MRRAWQTPASAIVRRVDSSRFTRFHENAGPDDGDAFTAPVAAGPYYIPDAPYRSDVREDRKGKPLVLKLGVISADSRQPLDGVTAELWQCDALGRYSGYLANDAGQFPDFLRLALEQFRPSDGTRFLRGKQNADSDGQVRFQTIVPGWYTPRTPHIHLKLSLVVASASDDAAVLPRRVSRIGGYWHPLRSTSAGPVHESQRCGAVPFQGRPWLLAGLRKFR